MGIFSEISMEQENSGELQPEKNDQPQVSLMESTTAAASVPEAEPAETQPSVDGQDKAETPGEDQDEDAKRKAHEAAEAKRKAEWEEFFLHALAYMVDHPRREWNENVRKDQGSSQYGYVVVRGADPVASGKKGDILAFAKEARKSRKIVQIALTRVDGKKIRADTWYDINFKERVVS